MTQPGKNGKTLKDAGGKTHRVFIAAALPGHITEALSSLQAGLKDFGVRMKYTDPENIHLTLKFLGDIRCEDIETAGKKLGDAVAGFYPPELFAKGLGVFPAIRRARVLWAGLAGQTQALGQLRQEVEDALAEAGFERENKRFSGHLTLGRFKGGIDQQLLAEAIRKFGGFVSEEFTVNCLNVFESTLTPKGPIYKVLSSQPLIKS